MFRKSTVVSSWVLTAIASLVLLTISGCDLFRSSEQLLSLGQAQLASADAVAALGFAKRVVAKDPKNLAARVLMADAALAQNDRETADQQLKKAQELGLSPAELLPRQWAVLRAKQDFDALLKAVATAPEAVPEAVKARFEGLALLGLHQEVQAGQAFERVLTANPKDAEAVVGLAQSQFIQGQHEQALQALEAAQNAFPTDAHVVLALGQAYTALGQASKAEAVFKQAITLTSPKGDLTAWLVAQSSAAQVALTQGHFSDAEKIIAELAKSAPNLAGTRLLQARLALVQHRLDEASRYAQAVVRVMPHDVSSRMLLAYITYSQGYFQQAESNLDEVLTERPDYAPARKLIAEIQLASNRAELAKRSLDPLIGASADGETLVLAGRIATALGDQTEAEAFYSRAVDATGAGDSLKLKIASQYLASGKRDRAVEILSKLPGGSDLTVRRDLLLALANGANQSPEVARQAIDSLAAKYVDDAVLQRTVAVIHAARGDYVAARARLQPLLKKNPDDTVSWLTLARVESADHHYEDAVSALHQVLSKNPKDVAALDELAAIALVRGDQDAAVKSLEAARAADAKAIEPRLTLARIYLNRDGNQAKAALNLAREPLKEALAIAPNRVDVLILAALTEKRDGHADEAERILKEAVASDGASASLWLSLGELQVADNRPEDAKASFKKALSLQPGWLPATKALAGILMRNNDYPAALGLVSNAAKVSGLSAASGRDQRAGALLLQGDLQATQAGLDAANAATLWAQAASSYASSFDVDPNYAAAVRVLNAKTMAGQPDPDNLLLAYLKQHPGDVSARGVLANFYATRGDRAKAIALYEAGVVLLPTQPALLNNLAWLYFEAKDARALPTARKALEYSQRQAQVVDTVGWILLQQNQGAEALPLLAEAHKSQPANPSITFHYASALAQSGKPAEARTLLRALLQEGTAFESRPAAVALAASLDGKAVQP